MRSRKSHVPYLVLIAAMLLALMPWQSQALAQDSETLTVFAAASLTESFTELGQAFEAERGDVRVVFNFAGSQQLAQQLGQGAPADVFASANNKQMGVAIEAGRVISGTQQTFANNRLVVIHPADNPAGLSQLQDLARPGLQLVLAAKEVPVGQYSQDFLDKASQDAAFGPTFKDDVLNNVVSYEENVKAVLTKIVLGEGDAGIVYTSDVTEEAANKVSSLEIPDELNTIAVYPIAQVSDSPNQQLAQAFIEYVLSPSGQAIIAKHGLVPITTIEAN